MFDLQDLYQEVILDHNRRPRNFGPMDDATHQAEGYNPLCGDKVKVFLRVVDGMVEAVQFEGAGCAISQASASAMTEALLGRPVAEAEAIFARMMGMLTEGDAEPADAAIEANFEDELEGLTVFAGVRDYPSRVKCATLAWHAFHEALAGEGSV